MYKDLGSSPCSLPSGEQLQVVVVLAQVVKSSSGVSVSIPFPIPAYFLSCQNKERWAEEDTRSLGSIDLVPTPSDNAGGQSELSKEPETEEGEVMRPGLGNGN